MKNIMLILLFVATWCTFLYQPAQAVWEHPVIKGYGPVQSFPNAVIKPDPSIKYRVVFEIMRGTTPDIANKGLGLVARFVNQMALYGIDPKQLNVVAVIHGDALPVVLNNIAYHMIFQKDNPNLALISELKKAGVKIVACGQALTESSYEPEWLNKEIDLAASALVAVANYQLKGYAYQPVF